jgi:hypothetical protein
MRRVDERVGIVVRYHAGAAFHIPDRDGGANSIANFKEARFVNGTSFAHRIESGALWADEPYDWTTTRSRGTMTAAHFAKDP